MSHLLPEDSDISETEWLQAAATNMISIAYAHGLEPIYDESLAKSRITPEVAVNL